MSIALALIALSAPRLTLAFYEQVDERYPQWALHTDESAGALVELVVKPNGRVESCELLDFVGSARLAEEMCEETEGLRLREATDAAGNPAYGVMRTLLRFTVPGRDLSLVEDSGEPSDIDVPTAQLPAGYGNGFVVEIDLMVDAEGSIEGCDAAYGGPPAVFEPYIATACERFGQLQLKPLVAAGGVATPYVARRRVRFTAEAPRS